MSVCNQRKEGRDADALLWPTVSIKPILNCLVRKEGRDDIWSENLERKTKRVCGKRMQVIMVLHLKDSAPWRLVITGNHHTSW